MGEWAVYCEPCQEVSRTPEPFAVDALMRAHLRLACRNVWVVPKGDTLRDGTRVA